MLRKIFRETLHANGMDRLMEEKGVVIAAFSGGADSSALLHLLAEYTADRGIRLIAAHVNHMIRGEDADGDEQFARETADRMNVPIHVKKADVPALAKETGVGLEEAARNVRYAFFEELSGEYGGAIVATAHNSDDNLETVLHHMMRGSGIKGLCGIAPVRDGRYIRPLIACDGKSVRNFCEKECIPYRLDSTNTDTAYTRNFIRHCIVPQLEKMCASPTDAVSRMTELLRCDSDFLEKEAAILCPDGTTVFDREKLNGLHPALSSRILRKMAAGCTDDSENTPELSHVKAMISLAASEKREGQISLPRGLVFRVTRKNVFFTFSEKEKNNGQKEKLCFPIDPTGDIFENERYKIIVSPKEHKVGTEEFENIYKLSIHKIMCSDKIIGTLYMKYRNQGDTYRYGGMTHKVKRIMIDRKLTAEEKRLMPFLCDDEGILWIPGCPLRDGVESKDSSEPMMHVYFFEKF